MQPCVDKVRSGKDERGRHFVFIITMIHKLTMNKAVAKVESDEIMNSACVTMYHSDRTEEERWRV